MTKMIDWCEKLRSDGVKINFENIDTEIKEQPIPDKIKDWKAWCLKWQERGLRFECDSGGYWKKGSWAFANEKEEYRIQAQPIPEAFIKQEETEMNAEEVTIKIKVSEDVTRLVVYVDGKAGNWCNIPHNAAGPAVMRFKREDNWQMSQPEYYLYSHKRDSKTFNILTATPKEMTVEEIEKALGYKVKVVGRE